MPVAGAILLAGMLNAAAQSTKRAAANANDSTKGDFYDVDLRAEGTGRLPSVFRNCEHPAAWSCTDGPPAAAGESRRGAYAVVPGHGELRVSV